MKFLFCCLASPGHVNPAIKIATKLREWGHEIAFVTHISLHDLLSRQGLQRIPLGVIDGPSFELDKWFNPPSVALQMKHINYALAQFPADVLVGQQFTFGPLLIGQHRHIPVGVLGLFSYLWPDFNSKPDEQLSLQQTTQAWRHREMLASFNQARSLLGFPPVTAAHRESPLLGDAFLLRNIPEIQNADTLPERIHLIGDCLWEEDVADPELDNWLDAAEARNSQILYLHHSREFHTPSFWPTVTAALADMNVSVAASIGRMDHKPQEWPVNFFVRDYIPQCRVFRRASAYVGSASTTAVLGALTHGVPCLFIYRNNGEEPEVAGICRAAGVARTPPETVSGEQFADELHCLLQDEHMRQISQHIASAFLRYDGTSRAAGFLEELGRTRTPILRSASMLTTSQAAG